MLCASPFAPFERVLLLLFCSVSFVPLLSVVLSDALFEGRCYAGIEHFAYESNNFRNRYAVRRA